MTPNSNQYNLTFQYKERLRASNMGHIMYGLPTGVLSGLTLSLTVGGNIIIATGNCILSNYADLYEENIAFNYELTDEVLLTLNTDFNSSENIIIIRMIYQETVGNAPEILGVDSSSLLEADIVLGVIEWNISGDPIDIDYTTRTNNILTTLDTHKTYLTVTPNNPIDTDINISAGNAIINNKLIEYAGGTKTLGAVVTSQITFVCLTESNTIELVSGTDAGSPTTPEIPNGYLPLARLTRSAGSNALGSEIENLYIDRVTSLNTDEDISFSALVTIEDALIETGDTTTLGYGYQAINSLTTGVQNLGVGYQTLKATTTGICNTAVGYQSMLNCVNGDYNSAFGVASLKALTTADYNCAFGRSCLESLTTAISCSAFGYNSLSTNVSGTQCSAFGANSLSANKANGNNAFGSNSLYNNTTGTTNCGFGNDTLYVGTTNQKCNAFGYQALFNSTDENNNAFGYHAGYDMTSGSDNTCMGNLALENCTTGSANSCFGSSAGSSITTGTNITCLGYNSQPTGGASTTNEVILGDSNVTTIGGYAAYSNHSDKRNKENIKDIKYGLEFIKKLRPVNYNLIFKSHTKTYNGFIAQEVEELEPSFSAINKPQDETGWYTLAYTEFIAPMVKAIQELSDRLDKLEKNDKK